MADSPRTTPVADLLALLRRDPGRPRLTWYGDEDERVELSGAVLENWVSKTVNLLVEEFDAGPGTHVLLDLPPHWRAVVWALAVWRAGACVVLVDTDDAADRGDAADTDSLPVPGAGAVDLVVTDRPAAHTARGVPVVAVSLPALARQFDTELPAGTIDAASAVMTYADRIGWVREADPAAEALEVGGRTAADHAGLAGWAAAGISVPVGTRVLTGGDGSQGFAVARVLRTVCGALGRDGSVVLVSSAQAAALAKDPGRRVDLVAAERVTQEDQVTQAG